MLYVKEGQSRAVRTQLEALSAAMQELLSQAQSIRTAHCRALATLNAEANKKIQTLGVLLEQGKNLLQPVRGLEEQSGLDIALDSCSDELQAGIQAYETERQEIARQEAELKQIEEKNALKLQVENMLEMATECLNEGDFAAAVAALTECVEITEQLSEVHLQIEAYHSLGHAYLALNMEEEAVYALTIYVQLSQQHAEFSDSAQLDAALRSLQCLEEPRGVEF